MDNDKTIPLAAPDGTIYAYACAVCHHVGGGVRGARAEAVENGPNQREVNYSREGALHCCTCRDCGKVERWVSLRCDACQAKRYAELAAGEPERQKEAVHQQKIRDAAFAKAKDVFAARLLASNMRDISENYFCAGWMLDIEYDLWEIVTHRYEEDEDQIFVGRLSNTEVDQLKRLSDAAGGWIYRDDDIKTEMFIPLDEWEQKYRAYVEKRKQKETTDQGKIV